MWQLAISHTRTNDFTPNFAQTNMIARMFQKFEVCIKNIAFSKITLFIWFQHRHNNKTIIYTGITPNDGSYKVRREQCIGMVVSLQDGVNFTSQQAFKE